jgi:hypothetical protein
MVDHARKRAGLTRFMRFMFMSGLNNLTVPSSHLYAFIPSNKQNA